MLRHTLPRETSPPAGPGDTPHRSPQRGSERRHPSVPPRLHAARRHRLARGLFSRVAPRTVPADQCTGTQNGGPHPATAQVLRRRGCSPPECTHTPGGPPVRAADCRPSQQASH